MYEASGQASTSEKDDLVEEVKEQVIIMPEFTLHLNFTRNYKGKISLKLLIIFLF